MLDLTPLQEQSVSAEVRRPNFLVTITLDQTLRYATRADTTWQGNFYEAGKIQLGRVSHKQAEFKIDNHDYSFTAGALAGSYMRAPVEIYWAYEGVLESEYVEPGYWAEGYVQGAGSLILNPILIFRGMIYETPRIENWLSVVCHRMPPRLYPFRKLRPPLANHTPSVGYTITFNGQVLNIQGKS